jgi:tetrahedral aminopeptidase
MTITIDRDLIKTLVEAWGPSGYEHEVRRLIEGYVRDLADEVRVDVGGNLICRMGSGDKKVMIAAHMDEIGLMVHHIDRHGFARFSMLGGLFPNTLNGNRVRFQNGVIGTISTEHALDITFSRVPKLAEMFVDFSTGKDSAADITVGSVGALTRDYTERGDRLIAKSMDDRIGCAVAIETMRKLKQTGTPHSVYFVFTTQEEVGTRGARMAGEAIQPDFAIAVDVGPVGDVPKSEEVQSKLGHGAGIVVRDVAHIVPMAVKDLLVKRAEAAGIPYQLHLMDLGSTDASAIQFAGSGVYAGVINVPCRYVHTTSETVDVNDLQACIDLLVAVLTQPLEGLA